MASESDNEAPETTAKETPRQRPKVTEGLKIRAVIDADVVKGLLIINGGGAVALLAFLPVALGKPEYRPLANAVLYGLLIFSTGLVFAVIHNRLRRVCSNVYDNHDYNPPPGKIWKFGLSVPTPCWFSMAFMWLSLLAFIVSVSIVFWGGRGSLSPPLDVVPQLNEPSNSG